MKWDERILRHWAKMLHADAEIFSRGGFIAHYVTEPDDYVVVYAIDDAQIVTVPRRFEEAVQDKPLPESADAAALSAWLNVALEHTYRDHTYYATTPLPEQPAMQNIRLLAAGDAALLDALQAECSEEELALSQITIEDPLISGYFDGDRLVGVGSLLDKGGDIFDIGVLTHPAHRGKSIAATLAAHLRNAVVGRGHVAQYITMESNRGSVGVARKCDFALFANEAGYAITAAD